MAPQKAPRAKKSTVGSTYEVGIRRFVILGAGRRRTPPAVCLFGTTATGILRGTSKSRAVLVTFDTTPPGGKQTGAMPMGMLDQFVTIKEAAKYLGVSPNTLRNWGMSGKITMHRNPMNNYRLFKKSDLDELLQQIDESGRHPTGWKRTSGRTNKPR